MAPNHLSVREMREDEKPLVLEMLKTRKTVWPSTP
ncbi:Probable N-acetyltransferase 14 [Apodemus speciosus]|uniref:Probable N-acetyltransferase 14 n=1 Tax=Apodemus speciosus TaxID=105296 RepID=A0ABQ0EWU4_APOSI